MEIIYSYMSLIVMNWWWLIFILGIITTVLTIIVFTKNKTATNGLLAGLAIGINVPLILSCFISGSIEFGYISQSDYALNYTFWDMIQTAAFGGIATIISFISFASSIIIIIKSIINLRKINNKNIDNKAIPGMGTQASAPTSTSVKQTGIFVNERKQ